MTTIQEILRTGWPTCTDWREAANRIDELEAQLAQYKADAAKNEIHLHIGKQVNRAYEVLPEGWEIAIHLERNAGTVYLIPPKGEPMPEFGGAEDFGYEISNAIDAAMKGTV